MTVQYYADKPLSYALLDLHLEQRPASRARRVAFDLRSKSIWWLASKMRTATAMPDAIASAALLAWTRSASMWEYMNGNLLEEMTRFIANFEHND